MRIITYTCPACGTIVAANELESVRVTKCPGISCDAVLRFDDLPERDREYVFESRERYGL
jgi:hypothetical protein